MKFLKLSVLLAALFLSHSAFSGEPGCPDDCPKQLYIFGYGGTNFGYDFRGGIDLESGAVYGGGLGIYSNFLCGSRFEIEAYQGENDLKNLGALAVQGGYVRNAGVNLNLLKDISFTDCLTGFIGGGFGLNETQFDFNNGQDTNTELTKHGIAGLEWHYCKSLSFFGQYRIMGVPSDEYRVNGVTIRTDTGISHAMQFGARFSF